MTQESRNIYSVTMYRHIIPFIRTVDVRNFMLFVLPSAMIQKLQQCKYAGGVIYPSPVACVRRPTSVAGGRPEG